MKSVRKTHLIQQLFDKICKEKYGITLVLILFMKTHWGTVRNAAKHLNRVRTAMCQLPTEIMSNDLNVDLPNDLRDLILTTSFWKGVAGVEVLFSAICSCLSYLEGDESTFSSVYATFWPLRTTFACYRRMSGPPWTLAMPMSTKCIRWFTIASRRSSRRRTLWLSAPTLYLTTCATI